MNSKHNGKDTFQTFKSIQDNLRRIVARATSYSGLPLDLVKNLLVYVESLPRKGTDIIDETVFIAQIAHQFNLQEIHMAKRMYQALKNPSQKTMTVEEFLLIICTFLTSNVDLQVELVFRVYDIAGQGEITKYQVTRWLQQTLMSTDEDEDTDHSLADLVELVMAMFDFDKNDTIDLQEYKELVKEKPLMIESLGQCMPHRNAVERFMALFQGKTSKEVADYWADERARCLRARDKKDDRNKLYDGMRFSIHY